MYINVCYKITRIDDNNKKKQNKNIDLRKKNLKWEKPLTKEKKIHSVKKLV